LISIGLYTKGLDEQIVKLERFPTIYHHNVKLAAMKSVIVMEANWIKIAPVYKARYRQSLMGAGKVESIPGGEIEAFVGTNVTNKGVSYPAVLNAGSDKRGRVFHYRSGPRAGQPLAGHVKKALVGSIKAITRFFKMAADGIIKDLKV
jgi:hypothetical protein